MKYTRLIFIFVFATLTVTVNFGAEGTKVLTDADASKIFIKPKNTDENSILKAYNESRFHELNKKLAEEREKKLAEDTGFAPPVVNVSELSNLRSGLENIAPEYNKADLRDVIHYLRINCDYDLAVRLAGLQEGIHIMGNFPRADVQKAIKQIQANCKNIPLANMRKAADNMTPSERSDPVNKVIIFALSDSKYSQLMNNLCFNKIADPKKTSKFNESHAIEEYTKEELARLADLKKYIDNHSQKTPDN